MIALASTGRMPPLNAENTTMISTIAGGLGSDKGVLDSNWMTMITPNVSNGPPNCCHPRMFVWLAAFCDHSRRRPFVDEILCSIDQPQCPQSKDHSHCRRSNLFAAEYNDECNDSWDVTLRKTHIHFMLTFRSAS